MSTLPIVGMNLENLQRISAASESACIGVLQSPNDPAARLRLIRVLRDLTDPAFQAEEATAYYSIQLVPEVRVWAQIVLTRALLAGRNTTPRSTSRIGYPGQLLLKALGDLRRECSRIDQVTNVG